MAEIELIQDRLISGKGVLRVPTDVVKNRFYVLYTDLVRPPNNKYVNLNYNPPRSQYAWLTFFRNGYLLDEKSIAFPKQVFDGVNDICGQTLLALKCSYAGTLQTFVNLGLALGLPPISVINTIADYQNLRLAWDEIRIVCYADTAIQCRLYRLKYDVCDADLDDDFPPPPPDPPVPPVPPTTPLDNISPAYDQDVDDGNTVPFPTDTNVPPPVGNACQAYTVVYGWINQLGEDQTASINVFGKVGRIKEVTGDPFEPSQIQMEFQGFPGFGCGAFQFRRVTGGAPPNEFNNPRIISIT